jgi:hypothetical protein
MLLIALASNLLLHCTACTQGASRADQYLLGEDLLVAPVIPFPIGNASRTVFVPPGQWQCAWNGSVIDGGTTGATIMLQAVPMAQVPLWHRKGSVLVTASEPGLSVSTQDWHNLTIEAFPFATDTTTVGITRTVRRQWYDTSEERGSMTVPQTDEAAADAATATPRAEIIMSQTTAGDITLVIGAMGSSSSSSPPTTSAGAPRVRTWYVRVHLSPSEHFGRVSPLVDGEPIPEQDYRVLGTHGALVARASQDVAPNANKTLLGVGSVPPYSAGPILEMKIQSTEGQSRTVSVKALRGWE